MSTCSPAYFMNSFKMSILLHPSITTGSTSLRENTIAVKKSNLILLL